MRAGQIVCLDNHVLIWGIKRQAIPDQQHMIERTRTFLQKLQDEGVTVVIPTVVLAEFLNHIPTEHHPNIIQQLSKSFVLAPFDAKTASLFSDIWKKKHGNGAIPTKPREGLKVDTQIVAVALANQASVIYSEDKDIRNFANGLIEVRDIPAIPTQLSLP